MIFVTKKFYITTAIPYVNAKPHLGHTLEFVQTDAIKRFHELFGEECFLVTGADENSLKNVQAAEKEGISVQELCDRNSEKFKELAKMVGLSYNCFRKSSSKTEHTPGIWELWNRCNKSEDIYKKKYKGLYCVGCEAFYKENELVDGLCPEHLKKPEEVEEENYFFKLSKYQKTLEDLIETDKLKIYPETRKKEILNFIREGLDDFSISRSKERAKGWGISVPSDSSQIIYVWFDALGCYITGIGFGYDEKLFEKFWPAEIHIIGKGITRFHAIYWIAMLLSAKLKLPKGLFIHGYITVEGQKMSKSLGNVLDPINLIEKYGSEEIRYYLLSEIPTFQDGDFSEGKMVEKINNELVANLGNLINRTMIFIEKNYNGTVPEFDGAGFTFEKIDPLYNNRIEKIKGIVENSANLKEALDEMMAISSLGNKYFQDSKPWESLKEGADKKAIEKSAKDLHLLANLIKDLAILAYPFLPESSKKICKMLNIEEKKWDYLGKISIEKGSKIGNAEILFKKIDQKKLQQTIPTEIKKEKEEIKFSDFDIEVGKIISCVKHPDAEKLLIEVVELSDGKRQIVSGIAEYYVPKEIIGKKVLILKNLKPAKIRGVLSQGMLLVGEHEKEIEIIEPLKNEIGDRLYLEGETLNPRKEIIFDDFLKIQILIENGQLKSNGKNVLSKNSKIATKKILNGKVR